VRPLTREMEALEERISEMRHALDFERAYLRDRVESIADTLDALRTKILGDLSNLRADLVKRGSL